MKNSIYLFLTIILLSSCGSVERTITIKEDGSFIQEVIFEEPRDFNLADFIIDDSDFDLANMDIERLFEEQKFDSLPNVIDTIIAVGSNTNSLNGIIPNSIGQKFQESMYMKFVMNKEADELKQIFGFSFESYIDKANMFEKLFVEGMKSDSVATLSEKDKEEAKMGLDLIRRFVGEFNIDIAKGQIEFLPLLFPREEFMADLPSKDEIFKLDEFTRSMMFGSMMGDITTRVTLPYKVSYVEGLDYKKIGENEVEMTMTVGDLVFSEGKDVLGFKILFETDEPITDPKVTEVWEPEPMAIKFDKKDIPSDAIVLFGGKTTNEWMHRDSSNINWDVKRKCMTINPGTNEIMTRKSFGDCQLHIEWRSPKEPNRVGQDKGNSGIFFQDKYEVQVLNSFDNRTYSNGQAASIYKQHSPLVNATYPAGEWNTYDIIYHQPQYDIDGTLNSKGTITVIHNGVLVQDHVAILGTTEYIGRPKSIPHGRGPIVLQDHSNKVSYRNIWIREL